MTCSVEGCDRPLIAHGLCTGHYQRLKKYGDVRADVPLRVVNRSGIASRGVPCAAEGCEREARVHGYCDGHYRRVQRFGDPRADVPLVKGVLQRKPPELRVCDVCGTEFPKRKGQTGQYCGRRCACIARAEELLAANIASGGFQRSGDKQRDRGNGRTYRKRNGRHEHRIVAEQKLGRSLKPDEIVHHIDGNVRNNHPDNLAVMTQREHVYVHELWNWRKAA